MDIQNQKDINKKSARMERSRFLVYILAVIVAGFIFVCWLYLLPYILKTNKAIEGQSENFQKINNEAMTTLSEVKELINNLGDKIHELKQATSTTKLEILQPDAN